MAASRRVGVKSPLGGQDRGRRWRAVVMEGVDGSTQVVGQVAQATGKETGDVHERPVPVAAGWPTRLFTSSQSDAHKKFESEIRPVRNVSGLSTKLGRSLAPASGHCVPLAPRIDTNTPLLCTCSPRYAPHRTHGLRQFSTPDAQHRSRPLSHSKLPCTKA